MARCRSLASAALAGIVLAGCRDSRAAEPRHASRAAEQRPAASAATRGDSSSAARPDTLRANGSLVLHPEYLQPNFARPGGVELRNPYEGQASAIATGEKLFVGYNCADCHGAGGSGAMGPSLADGRWHFGGSAGAIYESIAQGRPEGMPAWGSLLAPNQVWQLVAYLQSLEKGKNLSTENFTGQTVERTGH